MLLVDHHLLVVGRVLSHLELHPVAHSLVVSLFFIEIRGYLELRASRFEVEEERVGADSVAVHELRDLPAVQTQNPHFVLPVLCLKIIVELVPFGHEFLAPVAKRSVELYENVLLGQVFFEIVIVFLRCF